MKEVDLQSLMEEVRKCHKLRHRHHKDGFVLIFNKLVLIDTGLSFWQVWRSGALYYAFGGFWAFLFASSVFILLFFFSAFTFIACVKVIDKIHIQPSPFSHTLAPDRGLML